MSGCYFQLRQCTAITNPYTHTHKHTYGGSSEGNETLFIFTMDNPALLALLEQIEKARAGEGGGGMNNPPEKKKNFCPSFHQTFFTVCHDVTTKLSPKKTCIHMPAVQPNKSDYNNDAYACLHDNKGNQNNEKVVQ